MQLWSGGYRLPTEAEWEYACRAGTTTRFSSGDDEKALGQFAWLETERSRPAGERLPNAWGLFDMHGSLWKWCNDWYGADYDTELSNRSRVDFSASAVDDPSGPAMASERILRGGGWGAVVEYCGSASRYFSEPAYRGERVGFRVAAVPPGPGP